MRRATPAMRGAVSVVAAAWLTIAVICLMAIDIGHVFWQQREVQRLADLAALAGATAGATGCAAAARSNARDNGLSADTSVDTLTPECGNWNTAFDIPGVGGRPAQHFRVDATLPFNAARVKVTRRVPYLFLFAAPANSTARTVEASATGAVRDVAGFSLGTGVASLDAGVVNQLLSALLGTGSQLSLDALSYQGMLNSRVQLLDLVRAVPGVGNVQELLNTQLSIGDFIAAMARAASPTDAVAIAALNRIVAANVKSVTVRVSDILRVTTPSPEAAAAAQVNLLELLMTSAQIANGRNAVNLGTGLNLGALAKVTTQLVIVEPPAIAIGEAGRDASGQWKTQAHSASVRMLLDASVVDTTKLPVISSLVGIQMLHLPLYVEAAPGDAWLSQTSCADTRPASRVVIGSRPGVANVCIADNIAANMTNTSAPSNCSTPATISKVSVLPILFGGVSVLDVKATAPLTASTPLATAPDLSFDGVIGNADDIQRTNSNAVGSVLSTTVGGLTSGLKLNACVVSGLICLDASVLTNLLNTLRTAILVPLAGVLDSVFQPLLGLLGVQLGYSDVHHQSLVCGEPQLVY